MASLLSERIAELRRTRNLTQEQLGQLVGVSAQAVSKWEKGGAPDVELLPALADRLGVSIDALFGRGEDAPQNMTRLMGRWLRSIPQAERLNRLFQLLALTLPDIYLEPNNVNLEQVRAIPPTCYLHNLNAGTVWLRANFTTDEGMLSGVIAKDFPMYLLLPKPPEGYEVHFAPKGEYRKLFSVLAQEGSLELLLFLYHQNFGYFTPSALAKQAGLPLEQVEGLLPRLVDCHLLQEQPLELDDGPGKAYCVHDNHGLVPFLYFARWFMEESDGWTFGWEVRTKPILELTEDQLQRKRENKHEAKQ